MNLAGSLLAGIASLRMLIIDVDVRDEEPQTVEVDSMLYP
jgi:hypothetical protein